MAIPRIQIEAEFDRIVPVVGGELVRSRIEKSPMFDNADYIFPEYKLIAELKCLEQNKIDDARMQERFRRLWINWRQRSLVVGTVPRTINSRDLPVTCQNEMYKVMTKPIRRRVQKANKQIRETKAALGLHSYRGVLFIANDGNLMFPPAATIHAIQLCLHHDFREIRHFVFFTANLYAHVRGVDQPILCWISFDMENNKSGPAEDLYDSLRQHWVARHQKVTGIPFFQRELTDDQMEGFWFANYLQMR